MIETITFESGMQHRTLNIGDIEIVLFYGDDLDISVNDHYQSFNDDDIKYLHEMLTDYINCKQLDK